MEVPHQALKNTVLSTKIHPFRLPPKFAYPQYLTGFPFDFLFPPKKNSSSSSLLNMVTLNEIIMKYIYMKLLSGGEWT